MNTTKKNTTKSPLPFMILATLLLAGIAIGAEKTKDAPLKEQPIRLTGSIAIQQPESSKAGETKNVEAIAEIAKMTMESYDHKFELIKSIAIYTSALIGIAFAILAFLGVREFTQVTGVLRREHGEMMDTLKKETQHFSELNQALEKQKAEASRTIHALVRINAVSMKMTFYLSTGCTDNQLLRVMERELSAVCDEYASIDPRLAGWAYNIQAYIFKRLYGAKVALESAEFAIKVDPANDSAWFNAACYAALTGDKDKCLKYLVEAIRRYDGYRKDAATDGDFTALREDPSFRHLLQG